MRALANSLSQEQAALVILAFYVWSFIGDISSWSLNLLPIIGSIMPVLFCVHRVIENPHNLLTATYSRYSKAVFIAPTVLICLTWAFFNVFSLTPVERIFRELIACGSTSALT